MNNGKKPLQVRLASLFFVLVGIWIAGSGISNFARELRQQDWVVRMAEVTEVTWRRVSSGRVKHGSTKIVYDVTYQYHDNDDIYTGTITGTVTKWEIGDHFDIKCDPAAPENSTHILHPQPNVLVMDLLGGCLFAGIGLWAAGYLPFGRQR